MPATGAEAQGTASPYGRLVAQVLFPLQEMLKRHRTLEVRRSLEQSQWWPAEKLLDKQQRALHCLLLHAHATVPHYRSLFDRLRLDPAVMDGEALLQQLPLLSKADIKGQPDAFRSSIAGPLVRSNTGGSSGEPLAFYLGRDRISHDVAAKWRATRWWNVDIGERELVIWGSPIELKAQDRARVLRDRLMRSSLLPAFDLSTAKLDDYLATIQRQRPAMLFGYPSAISKIARHAETRHLRLDNIGVRVVFVTAERLYDEQRQDIRRVFGCPVANGYGGRDSGFIAHECPRGGMHISAEDIIVEVLDNAGQRVPNGSPGQIVVTHLASRDFPFIRYATGDIGVLSKSPCTCGRTLPLLEQIDGRSTDFLIAQDGTVMHGLALIYILRDLPQVQAFKIIQESLALTRVLLVAVPGLNDGMRRHIESAFRARLGGSVTIAIEEIAAIPTDASGKFRYVVSKVSLP
jgi:phenylacetate-CoA ligase